MEPFITFIHIVVALFMILVVLIQGGNAGGIGAAFGGGNTQGFFGATGATTFLGKLTYAAAFTFMLTTLSLAALQGGKSSVGLSQELQAQDTAAEVEKKTEAVEAKDVEVKEIPVDSTEK